VPTAVPMPLNKPKFPDEKGARGLAGGGQNPRPLTSPSLRPWTKAVISARFVLVKGAGSAGTLGSDLHPGGLCSEEDMGGSLKVTAWEKQ
jgi:hypothetical protein